MSFWWPFSIKPKSKEQKLQALLDALRTAERKFQYRVKRNGSANAKEPDVILQAVNELATQYQEKSRAHRLSRFAFPILLDRKTAQIAKEFKTSRMTLTRNGNRSMLKLSLYEENEERAEPVYQIDLTIRATSQSRDNTRASIEEEPVVNDQGDIVGAQYILAIPPKYSRRRLAHAVDRRPEYVRYKKYQKSVKTTKQADEGGIANGDL